MILTQPCLFVWYKRRGTFSFRWYAQVCVDKKRWEATVKKEEGERQEEDDEIKSEKKERIKKPTYIYIYIYRERER